MVLGFYEKSDSPHINESDLELLAAIDSFDKPIEEEKQLIYKGDDVFFENDHPYIIGEGHGQKWKEWINDEEWISKNVNR